MQNWLKKLLGANPQTQAAQVTFDEQQIIFVPPSGIEERISWDDLHKIEIYTTDKGPFVDDVWWVLHTANGGSAIGSETEGMSELLIRLQQLPNFDNRAVIDASMSVKKAQFTCWNRDMVDTTNADTSADQ